MTNIYYYFGLVYAIIFAFVIIIINPSIFSDDNYIIKNLISHEFISIIGIVLALVFQSIMNSAFRLREIESRYDKKMTATRKKMRQCILIMIFCFVVIFFAIILKYPLFGEIYSGYLNGFCLVVFFYMLSVMWDAIALALSIEEE